MTIKKLGLSKPTYNFLRLAKIRTFDQLLGKSLQDLRGISLDSRFELHQLFMKKNVSHGLAYEIKVAEKIATGLIIRIYL